MCIRARCDPGCNAWVWRSRSGETSPQLALWLPAGPAAAAHPARTNPAAPTAPVAAGAPAPPVGAIEVMSSGRQRVVQIGVIIMAIALFIIIRSKPGG